ncbi:Putative F-box/LRR-repeat protein [Apostasia shenzhenica]|uniref:F-box/LRR-repeat protein n=1 Tax=Apostasia shenzhenica TaxID=1088818 RepID=A0A2I0BFD1_9ASPA|nr:Putative F-box/LRR-repeat protein [Apostasia shenzhenica]
MVAEGRQEITCGGSGRPPKFRVGEREDDCERISELPDHLLLHILSFLCIDDAIPTSLLCRRWRYLWRSIDSLDFPQHCGERKGNSVEFIDRILALHEGLKIKRFCARIHYNSSYVSHLDSWMNFAVARNVEKLVLDLFAVENGFPSYVLPRSVFNCGSLVELDLNLCHLRLPPSFRLASLKKLAIANTVFIGNALRDLVSGSPVLEELILVNCNRARDLDIVVLNQSVKKMKVVEFPDEFEEGTDLKVYAPHLRHFELQSGEPRPCRIGDLSSIVSASLEIRKTNTCLQYDPNLKNNCVQIVSRLLLGLHEVKTLRLSSWCVQNLISCKASLSPKEMRHYLPTQLQNLEHLKIELQLLEDELLGIIFLLRNSPKLERLTIHICRRPHIDMAMENGNPCLYNWTEECLWNCNPSSSYIPSRHLKEIIVENFKGEDNEIKFLEIVLKNSIISKKMVIVIPQKSFYGSGESYLECCRKDGKASIQYMKNIEKLLTLQRSAYADILFAGSYATSISSS